MEVITQILDNSRIRLDGNTQSRVGTNTEFINELREVIRNDVTLPPGIAYFDGEDYWPADGHHRHLAYAAEEVTEHEWIVRTGTRTDAAWASLSMNSDHGLRRTKDDLAKTIARAIEIGRARGLSNAQIAEHIHVHPGTIGRHRQRVEAQAGVARAIPELRLGKDGKQYHVHSSTATLDTTTPTGLSSDAVAPQDNDVCPTASVTPAALLEHESVVIDETSFPTAPWIENDDLLAVSASAKANAISKAQRALCRFAHCVDEVQSVAGDITQHSSCCTDISSLSNKLDNWGTQSADAGTKAA